MKSRNTQEGGKSGHAGHSHVHDSAGDIGFAFFLNLGFAIAEIAGGLWTNSLAILSDALHDFGDALILGLSWILERVAGRERTPRYSYGYRRLSLLGAMINAVVLIAGSVFIIMEALPRLADPTEPHAQGMMWFAIAGVLLNGVAALRLRRGRSMNARLVSWHLFEDVLGWAAVLVASVVMQFWHVPVLDAILSLLIASYILYYNVVVNINKTIQLFLQAVPENVDAAAMEQELCAIDGVRSVHHLHVWSLDGAHHVVSAHLVLSAARTREEVVDIKQRARRLLLAHDIEHITLDIEFEGEDCLMGGEWNANEHTREDTAHGAHHHG
ncbi:MAG: cation diffusion facilitator family transporter [Bacteroidota bacterium]|nr:cation diffusion facilitator family transporter [Bacteroidota bacterium]